MTTLEIIKFLVEAGGEDPCGMGLDFAAEHPDPFEAIEAATSSDDPDVRQFVRWACWQPAVMGMGEYNALRNDFNDEERMDLNSTAYRRLTERCAKELREWLHGFLAGREIVKGEQA